MNRDDDNGFLLLWICLIAGLFALVVLSDLIGRLYQIFYHEWTYIFWGMAAIIFTGAVIVVHFSFKRELHEYRDELKKKMDRVEYLSGRFESSERHAQNLIQTFGQSFSSQLESHARLCERTIQKVAKLEEQKGPITIQASKEVRAAMTEVVSGGGS